MATKSYSLGEMEEEEEKKQKQQRKKEALGWIEWLRGWFCVIYEMLFQRIMASHLQNPLPLPPANDLSCIVTGSTSGIGREIARFGFPFRFPINEAHVENHKIFEFSKSYLSRQLAEAGAHVVMAVRNTKVAHELIQKWQNEWSGMGLPLNLEVIGDWNVLSIDCKFLYPKLLHLVKRFYMLSEY